ncbi:hypothetical protein, partial [Arthrobacter sp. H14]|uniref:hypothetical protein n=1 Tax=Arthrobacter sp. H14 TaxID=1312959 RepID=UPI00068845F9
MSASTSEAPSGRRDPQESVEQWLQASGLSFTADHLASALKDRTVRTPEAVRLPEQEQAVWDEHAGVPAPTAEEIAASSAGSAAARILVESASLTASGMAERTGLSASTIRHYRADRKIYSYTRGSTVLFPDWQLTNSGGLLPSLGVVLQALPDDLHPQTVAGLFLTPQQDLELDGRPVSPKEWLER